MQTPQLDELRQGLAYLANVTAERVNGMARDFPLSFVVQTTDDDVIEYESSGVASSEGEACVRAYQLGVRLGEEIGLTHIVATFMQAEVRLRDTTTNRVALDAIATVGAVCTGERLAVAQEITRDANNVMFLGSPQFSVSASSPVMDALICGLDSTREQTHQRWLA